MNEAYFLTVSAITILVTGRSGYRLTQTAKGQIIISRGRYTYIEYAQDAYKIAETDQSLEKEDLFTDRQRQETTGRGNTLHSRLKRY